MHLNHIPFQENYRNELLNIWEASVRATHTFISNEDLLFYKALVEKIEFEKLNTHLVFLEGKEFIGFWGTEGKTLVMLFLRPNCMGKGIGKSILNHILRSHSINTLDVNEQNTGAVGFYQKMGFEITERKPLDDLGKPYPILKMQRK